MKTAIVTHYIPWMPYSGDFWKISSEQSKAWATKLGWEIYADSKRRLADPFIYREKAAMLSEVMGECEDGDRILWLDGDALIVRDPSAIFDDLKGADLGMVKFVHRRWNSGVCAMVVNPATRALWPEVVTHAHTRDTPFVDGPLTENVCEDWTAHECDNCPHTPGNRGPLCGSSKTMVIELDRRFNEHWEARDENTRIFGFHMMGAHRTGRLMREALAWLI